MKKLSKMTLKEMEVNFSTIPVSIQEMIKGGDVTVTFDKSDNMIYVYGDGTLVGSYSAGNNTDSGSNGAWSTGTYAMSTQSSPVTHSGDSYSSSFGTYGIYQAAGFYDANGTYRTYMGLHSGRSDDTSYPTYGCIRTTDAAMAEIAAFISSCGSFTSITVRT